jgi:hypothetical protein
MGNFENGYALIIGVGADLKQTLKDARALYDLLIDPHRAGYPPENVELLTDETNPKANRQGILDAFGRLRDKTAINPNATVLVYYSGHGYELTLNNKPLGYFLLPVDYDLDDLNNTCLSGKEFTDCYKAIQAEKKIVFLDCCYAAAIPRIKKGDALETKLKNMPDELKELDVGTGQIVVASCDAKENSYADEENSVFTRALLEALDGKANPLDEYARIYEVLSYLCWQVPQLAASIHVNGQPGQQHVVVPFMTGAKGDFALCRISPTTISTRIIRDPRNDYLYKALLPIGFPAERLNFINLRNASKINAYLIHGGPMYGHYWLLARLLDVLKKEGGVPCDPIDLSCPDNYPYVDSLWNNLHDTFSGGEDTSREQIYQSVADALQNHPIYIILEKVNTIKEHEIPGILDKFWKVLAEEVRKKLKDPTCFGLYLFLIFHELSGEAWPAGQPEKSDLVDLPYNWVDIPLPLMEQVLTSVSFNNSAIINLLRDNKSLGPTDLVETKFQQLWDKSQDHLYEQMAIQFFSLFHAKYGGTRQWLTTL